MWGHSWSFLFRLFSLGMVAHDRPDWAARFGPIPRPNTEVSKKTVQNRNAIARAILRRSCGGILPKTPGGYRQSQVVPEHARKRAPKATPEVLLNTLMDRHKSLCSKGAFAAARGGIYVYADGTRKLEKHLFENLTHLKWARGAALCPLQGLQTFVHLAERDALLHEGDYPPSLLLFLDGAKILGDREVHLLSASLPQAKRPHQIRAQLCIARYLAHDCAFRHAQVFAKLGLGDAIARVLAQGLNGRRLRLVMGPDWKVLRILSNWVGPGDQWCCMFCFSAKAQWQARDFSGAPLRDFDCWDTPLAPILGHFESILDIVYDPLHCVALLLSHTVCHALYFWAKSKIGESLAESLVALYKRHTGPAEQVFCEAADEVVSLKDYAMNNKSAKKIVKSDTFWRELSALLPTTRGGLFLRHPLLNKGEPVQDPLQRYLWLVRFLCVQVLSWTPRMVDTRDAKCQEAHYLYFCLGLPPRRYNVAAHYFFFHYTPRFFRHGNLVGLSTEGGEANHKPHKKICGLNGAMRPFQCPDGIWESVCWSTRALAFWRQGLQIPCTWYDMRPTLPPTP